MTPLKDQSIDRGPFQEWRRNNGVKDSFTGWVLALYRNKFQNRTFVFRGMDVYEVQRLESNTAFGQRL